MYNFKKIFTKDKEFIGPLGETYFIINYKEKGGSPKTDLRLPLKDLEDLLSNIKELEYIEVYKNKN